jgi:CRISPR-associated endonuclease/helicase Cas3
LQGSWNNLEERRAEVDAPWTMKQLIPAGEQETSSEEDSRREQMYTWDKVHHPSQINGALRIVLPPELATYDSELGFRLLTKPGETSAGWISAPIDDRKGKPSFAKREQRSYVEHITGLMRAYDWSIRRELAWIARRMQSALSLPDDALDMAIRFAIAFHDLGKLCIGWQQWAHTYQQQLVAQHGARFNVPPSRQFLAKTDMLDNWRADQAFRAQLKQKRPPSHAVAGTMANEGLFGQYLLTAFGTDDIDALTSAQIEGGKALRQATLSAIAHHHSPNATTFDALAWEDGVREPIEAALAACRITADISPLDLSARSEGKIGEELLTLPERDGETATWLAFVLVRALRLCDQRAEREL